MLSQSQVLEKDRATTLAQSAVDLINDGQFEPASRRLREAASLGPNNPDVRAALLQLHYSQEISPIVNACNLYISDPNSSSGKDVTRMLTDSDHHVPKEAALGILRSILEKKPSDLTSEQDDILVALISSSPDVRRHLMAEFKKSPTQLFDNVYERGDGIVNNLRSIVSDRSLWYDEAQRKEAERDLFQLLLAKLMESGHDHDGRSLRGLALLLATDADAVSSLMDSDSFDTILACLDIRLSPDVRNQATLATSKYMEAAKEEGQKMFTQFVVSKAAKKKKDDTIVAFSAAASLFPIVPNVIAPLFLTEGFLPSLLPSLDNTLKRSKVEDAFLFLLNSACIDGACRLAVRKYCTDWLDQMLVEGTEDQQAVSATILAKVGISETMNDQQQDGAVHKADVDMEEVVQMLQKTIYTQDFAGSLSSLEGLAYASLDPKVKEEIIKDTRFLKKLYDILGQSDNSAEVVIGGLSILSNLAQYQPNLSEEQKKLAQLKAYANTSKSRPPNPLNDDEHVGRRCDILVETDIMPVLVKSSPRSSPSAKKLIDKILLSLSKNQKTRGKLAQQGAVRLLMQHLRAATGPTEGESYEAAHALARILISVNPSHVFPATGSLQAANAAPCLVSLLKDPESANSDGPRDLLPVFESLLALTNLASSTDDTVAEAIMRHAWDTVEDLLLAKNTMIQRAACELVCNLAATEAGVAKFADGSKRAGHRLHLILALADVEDISTRKAAGGALAMLTEFESAVNGILDIKRGIEILFDLCKEEDEGLVHRGLVCIRNIVCAVGETGRRGKEEVKRAGGLDILMGCLKKSRNQNLLSVGVEALKACQS
ncbi:MAG: hypothetical protein Q9227_004487 [Pyrenula ochraceoflavens]